MQSQPDWNKVKRDVFDAFRRDERISVNDLEEIIDTGIGGGGFDEQEKAMLITIITRMTSADLSGTMWAKVDDLIQTFSADEDSSVRIESLDSHNDVVELE